MAKRTDNAGSTTHDGVIRSNRDPRGEPESVREVKGRAQKALRETQGNDECQVHWDQTSNAQPSDEANYRKGGTSGFAFVEGSGSLARDPKKAKPYPGENWTDPSTVQWANEKSYQDYDHSPSRKPNAVDPEPAPKSPYYVGARNPDSNITTTRVNRDSRRGRLSKPSADVFHNKDEKKQGINMGDRAEHTAEATDPQRRETSVKVENKVLDCEQTERGTAGSDALLKQLGRNGYRRNT